MKIVSLVLSNVNNKSQTHSGFPKRFVYFNCYVCSYRNRYYRVQLTNHLGSAKIKSVEELFPQTDGTFQDINGETIQSNNLIKLLEEPKPFNYIELEV